MNLWKRVGALERRLDRLDRYLPDIHETQVGHEPPAAYWAEMTLGERLEMGLVQWGGGVMAFTEAMALTGIRGATYPAIRRYLDDRTEPSLSFIKAAAQLLGVSFPWLATGYVEQKQGAQP